MLSDSRAILLPPLAALALAGCDAKFHAKDDDGSGNVAIAMGGAGNDSGAVSIATPVFSANVKLPGLKLGGGDMDLDGIKLYPGTSVTGVNVDAQDKAGDEDKGVVRIAFTRPDAPAKLIDYYARSARDNGFAADAPGATALHATKQEDGKPKSFDLAVRPAGAGSTGALTLTGE